MEAVTPLSPSTRWGMVFTGIAQGGLCYLLLMHLIPEHSGWMFYALPASLAFSSVLLFTVVSFRQRALWGWLAVVLVVVLGMGGWLTHALDGLDRWEREGAMWAYGWSLLLMALLALPWLQYRIQKTTGTARYAHFYRQQWQNMLTVLLIGVANGLVVLVLLLWSGLFQLANINFFSQLFFESRWFLFLTLGLVTALTVILARQNERLIAASYKLLALVATGLLPLVSLLALMFLITLPFAGVTAISARFSAASLLSSLAFIQLLLTAMVWEPQSPRLGYPRALRYLILAAIMLTPVYAAIAGWALWVRIGQYGWTPDRLHGALVVVVLLAWSLGYLASLLRRRDNPAPLMGRVHMGVSLLGLALLILLYTPVLDSWRISVNSHMARYHSGKITANEVSLYMLASTGKPGRDALLALQKDTEFTRDAKRRQQLSRVLNNDQGPTGKLTPDMLAKNVVVAQGSLPPDAALWKAVMEERYLTESCREAGMCVLVSQDLNGDGQPEQVLYVFGEGNALVFSRQEKGWIYRASGKLPSTLTKAALMQAVEEGRVGVKPKAWQDMTLGDETVKLKYRQE